MLPAAWVCKVTGVIRQHAGANGTANATSVQIQLDCHPDYVQLCGVCTPRCATIDLNARSSDTIRAVGPISVLTSVLTSIIGFVVFLIMAVIRRKHMRDYKLIL